MKTSKKLVFLRFSSLGDVAITIPLIRCFLSKYPDISITFVTKNFYVPLLQEFKNLEVLELDSKGRHNGLKGLTHLINKKEFLIFEDFFRSVWDDEQTLNKSF